MSLSKKCFREMVVFVYLEMVKLFLPVGLKPDLSDLIDLQSQTDAAQLRLQVLQSFCYASVLHALAACLERYRFQLVTE